jgi:hypothetical protein
LLHQVADDLLHSPFGDPDRLRDVARTGIRIASRRDHHVPLGLNTKHTS